MTHRAWGRQVRAAPSLHTYNYFPNDILGNARYESKNYDEKMPSRGQLNIGDLVFFTVGIILGLT